ncbi:hypothetical protein LTR78_009545 [Recurvomyces mirabilis]|uniref:Uncharacterized protein n=1 Tax=Recurvomyces mirabilis TaxID=574656 RepID=A0AAE0TNL2_9PEZI|nr:hypothetical protein LTR78_009545 [Recurvomyces mirabilis]KAK5150000.1 hypothetical protein LTS14_010472 [Recurvomyces mirabilis]
MSLVGRKLAVVSAKCRAQASGKLPGTERLFKSVAASQQESSSTPTHIAASGQSLLHRSAKGGHFQTSRIAHASPSTSPIYETTTNATTTSGWDPQAFDVSLLWLRDLCECSRCVDPSTKQKLFSTVDIPPNIQGTRLPSSDDAKITLRWTNDIVGYGNDHVTTLSTEMYSQNSRNSSGGPLFDIPARNLWLAQHFRAKCEDMDYEHYMQSDHSVLQALQQLHTHGLLFLTNVPDSEKSVSAIVERIGPLKNTFYGSTWDVRSVPEAKNVAYTAQDLGFHMDLMYMQQPPHLQFLHCIRSSAAGGASLFTDSFRAARDLWVDDPDSVRNLAQLPVNFHYNHPELHYYHQSRRVVELKDGASLDSLPSGEQGAKMLADAIRNVSWAPPFQAPFINPNAKKLEEISGETLIRWHAAARKFSEAVHQPAGIYERMMRPGECVIFDNRRVLHARRAFEVGDAGKERWLRGAYMDEDPFLSKTKVMQKLQATV